MAVMLQGIKDEFRSYFRSKIKRLPVKEKQKLNYSVKF